MRRDDPTTPAGPRALLSDWSLSATSAGIVAALVSYAGPFAVVLQATRAAQLDAAATSSWVWAIAVGSGISGVALSLLTRMPIIVAWSTPGAALLIASIGGYRFSDAVGAFLVASVCAAVVGFTGWFGRLISLVPSSIMSALLAGILLPFVISGSVAVVGSPVVAGSVVLAFVVAKRWAERFAVVIALATGVLATLATGGLGAAGGGLDLRLTTPILITPTFDLQALLSIGLPLLLITLAGQNAPGLTVLRTHGYDPDDRLLVGGVSLVSASLTPFGGHATNLAAITAAICTGPEAHPDPRRRYVAGVVCGVANLAAGAVAAWLVSAYTALPAPMIAALAAVALVASVIGALAATLSVPGPTQTAAVITLAVTASGVVVAGIGSAFWGLVAGVVVWAILTGGASEDAVSAGAPPRS
ncbi:MAG: benzoate/H(+) symporter BenE family transporter [Dermatophilaceae bacterium]|jgi:benzoate membrane transport protein|nr:benzoate/H(+) symporter BenE family transporter [Dermatophilaceae bacterium]MBP9919175.1 benzoate/H(+) symporter BenE family transporter [Dermatophilaceae bacterium]